MPGRSGVPRSRDGDSDGDTARSVSARSGSARPGSARAGSSPGTDLSPSALLARTTGLVRSAVEVAFGVPEAGLATARLLLGLPARLDDLLEELVVDVARLSAVLAAVEPLPAVLGQVLRQAAGVVEDLGPVAASAAAVVGEIRPLVLDVGATVAGAGAGLQEVVRLTASVAGVEERIRRVVTDLEPLLSALAALDPALPSHLASVLADAVPLLAGVRDLPQDLLDEALATLRRLPSLLDDVEGRVLPSVESLEGLVPVVAQLGVGVGNLNVVVADVGALLGGIPGASRLVRRGERPARS
ncbi:MAG: hypothetical protein JWN17_2432 [Frankiales bacterium]|nr:hypothetical protein [Frankiales bacterium]